MRLCEITQGAINRAPSRKLPLRAGHGDANPGNFILHDDGAVYGLDLLRPVPQHLCQDLAYLIARSLPHLPGEGPLGQVMARLGQLLRDDLGVDEDMVAATSLYLRMEILNLWRRVSLADAATRKPVPRFVRRLVDGPDLSGVHL